MFLSKLYEDARRGGKIPGELDLGDLLHVADEAIEAAVERTLEVASETIKTEQASQVPNWALLSMLIAGGIKTLSAKVERMNRNDEPRDPSSDPDARRYDSWD